VNTSFPRLSLTPRKGTNDLCHTICSDLGWQYGHNASRHPMNAENELIYREGEQRRDSGDTVCI
jgi:hypothetical protein